MTKSSGTRLNRTSENRRVRPPTQPAPWSMRERIRPTPTHGNSSTGIKCVPMVFSSGMSAMSGTKLVGIVPHRPSPAGRTIFLFRLASAQLLGFFRICHFFTHAECKNLRYQKFRFYTSAPSPLRHKQVAPLSKVPANALLLSFRLTFQLSTSLITSKIILMPSLSFC